jgi:hypothetical protein
MMFDPTSLIADNSAILPDTNLLTTKAYLKANGFETDFGNPDTINKFNNFAQVEVADGNYAGKSLELGEGGRAALLRHQLVVSGKFGNSLDEITPEAWGKINEIIRINYMNKYGAK